MKRKTVAMPATYAQELPSWLKSKRWVLPWLYVDYPREPFMNTKYTPRGPEKWGEGITVSR